MSDRETARLDAAAVGLVNAQTNGLCTDRWPRACSHCDCFRDGHAGPGMDAFRMERGIAAETLAAADQWDRDNGYVTIKLDGTFATPGGFLYLSNLLKAEPTRETLLAVAEALREAAEQ